MSAEPAFLSIVIPTLDEGPRLRAQLQALAPWRAEGVELVVVDGGSRDGSTESLADLADLVLQAPRGRASQMNAGAARARGQWLLFLHVDTQLPGPAWPLLQRCLDPRVVWGRFDVRIDSPRTVLRGVGTLMNWRSRLTGVATGDQALFVRRSCFEALGGYADLALMEDIELCGRLRRLARPLCLRLQVLTSARRWERHGVWRTIVLMWRLRAAYFWGADPNRLARLYGYQPRER